MALSRQVEENDNEVDEDIDICIMYGNHDNHWQRKDNSDECCVDIKIPPIPPPNPQIPQPIYFKILLGI